ncbi:MAG: PxKF domain-containing protein, partial [Actinomycetota bacterium]|nr:PxKF domain-containing protein [Actinomycetota bacterium]
MLGIANRTRLVALAVLTIGLAVALPAMKASADVVVSFNPVYVPFHEEANTNCVGWCTSGPADLTVGADGAIWFTQVQGNHIARLDATTLELREWRIPTDYARPKGIVATPDGKVWFLEHQAFQLGSFDPATETFQEFPIGFPRNWSPGCCGGYGQDIALGPDGAIWIVAQQMIHRFDPDTREWTWTDVYGGNPGWFPNFRSITAGPDGKLYLADNTGQGIWQMEPGPLNNAYYSLTLTEQGPNPRFRFFPVPGTEVTCGPSHGDCVWGGPYPPNIGLSEVAAAADGTIWFTAWSEHMVGKMAPGGDFTLFDLGRHNWPGAVTEGPDGGIWFFATGELRDGRYGQSIGRIGPNGGYRMFTLPFAWPTMNYPIGNVVAGPPGQRSVWYTDLSGNYVGRVNIGSVTGGGDAMTGSNPSAAHPVQVTVGSPVDGSVSIDIVPPTQPGPGGYSFLDYQVDIEAPASATGLTILFQVHDSIVPAGADSETLQIFRDGVRLPNCEQDVFGTPDPCIYERGRGDDHVTLRVFTSHASSWNIAPQPPIPFEGFSAPVDDQPTVNVAKAGTAIPVKFSLGGDHGLDVLAPGYPQARAVDCRTGAALDAIEQTATAGASDL